MGGRVPLGYEKDERTLRINEACAPSNGLPLMEPVQAGCRVSVQLEHDSPEVKIRTWKKELS